MLVPSSARFSPRPRTRAPSRLGAACQALLLPLAVALAACGEDAVSPLPENVPALARDHAALVHAAYEDSSRAATDLVTAVEAFVADPTPATLAAAREAWLDAREPYLQTEVFRFYDGPIDAAPDNLEAMINGWPMDEAYIDAIASDPLGGIINDPATAISPSVLMALNAQGGDQNIATGFHAIEFLLWGEDRSADGPGDRPASDFADGGTAPNADRRRSYLRVVTTLLDEQLARVRDAWAPARDNYRADFEVAAPSEVLRRILTGMITLSGFETGGERLQAALDSGSQEDEHSCFSDNTHRDMVQDIVGVRNVWRGELVRTDGTRMSGIGMRDVVAEVDPELAAAVEAKIDASLALAEALVPPFDQEIALGNSAGRARVQALIVSLHAQERLLQDVFRRFGLAVPVNP